ncbi:MAG TPA: CPBP family intramembrane metalloprotease [Anaerolineae bacterium]|mgnify:CR=1 FL=1|nr:CPBP family intramembrane metalloprotease [Anaerolineae bacterium]HQI84755.1 CPBP family intramembrane metalloprotease [Anaerolineae bacterium]
MNTLKSFATNSPVLFAISLMVAWFVAALVFTGIASGVLHRPYGDAVTTTVGRLAVTACVFWLAWRLGWLEAAGVTRLGRWQVWALAVVGMLYFAGASLFAFYGKVAFDISSLTRATAFNATVLTHAVVALSEELLFRGVMLYVLLHAWGHTRLGIIGSVVLSAVLFALMHITQVFTHGASWSSVLLLTVQTCISAVWWGAVVVWGGSLWPAVLLHFVGNAVVAVQGLTTPMITPGILAYRRLLWFSLPLGILGSGLLVQMALPPAVTDAS